MYCLGSSIDTLLHPCCSRTKDHKGTGTGIAMQPSGPFREVERTGSFATGLDHACIERAFCPYLAGRTDYRIDSAAARRGKRDRVMA